MKAPFKNPSTVKLCVFLINQFAVVSIGFYTAVCSLSVQIRISGQINPDLPVLY
jgi:hypothetical protein